MHTFLTALLTAALSVLTTAAEFGRLSAVARLLHPADRSPFRTVWDGLGPLKPLAGDHSTFTTNGFVYHVGWIGGQRDTMTH